MNATGGMHKWTALHLAAHGGNLNIVKILLVAGADIFQRNTNNQLPRHCAKGNYILTKFIKMAEQSYTTQEYNSYLIYNQFQLIRGLTMRKPMNARSYQFKDIIQGYNNFVGSLKLVRKYRPLADSDNLPKICQPEDYFEVTSPRSSSEGSGTEEGDDGDDDEERERDAHTQPQDTNSLD